MDQLLPEKKEGRGGGGKKDQTIPLREFGRSVPIVSEERDGGRVGRGCLYPARILRVERDAGRGGRGWVSPIFRVEREAGRLGSG